MICSHVQRWRERRGSYRPAGEPFEARRYEVEAVPDDTRPRAFVQAHHSSGTYPAARFRFLLHDDWAGLAARGPAAKGLDQSVVGAAVFSVPTRRAVTTNHFEGDALAHVELGRLVLLDEVPGNAESWLVARCFEALAREGIEGVVSFADPVRRTDSDGRAVMPGHVGTVYQALGAVHNGRATARSLRLLPDGSVFSDRARSKVRRAEQGMAYAVAQLVQAGAPVPTDDVLARDGERRAWLASAVDRVTRPLRHRGNLRYLWALGRGRLRPSVKPLAYPKWADVVQTAGLPLFS